jgi:excisionase family DNA binding protein
MLTPPQVAARFGIRADKVLGWIRAGELRACNVAARLGGRPRWRISEADLLAFVQARGAGTGVSRGRVRRRREAGVIEFF